MSSSRAISGATLNSGMFLVVLCDDATQQAPAWQPQREMGCVCVEGEGAPFPNVHVAGWPTMWVQLTAAGPAVATGEAACAQITMHVHVHVAWRVPTVRVRVPPRSTPCKSCLSLTLCGCMQHGSRHTPQPHRRSCARSTGTLM